jgi:hypothetical protein
VNAVQTLERLTGLSAARTRFGAKAERLVPFFFETDAIADRVVASGAASSAELDAQVAHVPFWVDRERCNRGGAVVIRAGLLSGVALMGSLAKSYCSSGGNKPLIQSGALINDTGPRLARTADFVRVVSQKDALLPGAPGLKSILRVRLAHAHVRRACLRDGAWPTLRFGHPINQADMAATVLLFSEQLVRNIRALGGVVSKREESDVLHLWRYIGYLLGVEAELLCTEPKEARLLADLIESIDQGPDEDSRRLIKALFTPPPDAELPMPRKVAEAALELYKAACRKLIGDTFADAVGLPDRGLGPVLFASRVGIRAATSALNALPLGDLLQANLGASYWSNLATQK